VDSDLSPTPESLITLEEAHFLTGLSVKTLRDSYCRKDRLPGAHLGKRSPRDPKPMWLIPERALESAGLMAQPSASQVDMLPLKAAETVDAAGAVLNRADAFLSFGERFLTETAAALREAGSAVVWQQVAETERRNVAELTARVGILEAQVQTLAADRDRLAAELAAERNRPLTAAEMWWGRRSR